MLVLRRKVGETIVLTGPDGTVMKFTVLDVRPKGNVGFWFDVPDSVIVDRLEVHERKQLKLKEQGHAEREAQEHTQEGTSAAQA